MGYVELVYLDLGLAVAVVAVAALAAQLRLSGQPARRVLPLLAGALLLVTARAATALALGAGDGSFATRRLAFQLPARRAPPADRAGHPQPRRGLRRPAPRAAVAVVDLLVVPSPATTAAARGARPRRPAAAARRSRRPGAEAARCSPCPPWSSSWRWPPRGGPAGSPTSSPAPARRLRRGGGQRRRPARPAGASGRTPTSSSPPPRSPVDGRDALAFNGTVPGPELRVTQGDLVEVVLRNADVEDGVTRPLARRRRARTPRTASRASRRTRSPPARTHTYRFRAEQAGTFWYHSHQQSSVQVERGLYGALVVAPTRRRPTRRPT